MKVRIRWFGGKEYDRPILVYKNWEFDVSDFNDEVPRLGDKILLSLPITRDDSSLFNIESSSWDFHVTERRWCPELSQKTVELEVELDNPKDFWHLPDETKNRLVEKLEEEENNRRTELFQQSDRGIETH
jgi:hypothetical protein